MLSYAGRIQLIKSVIFGIQSYWSQIFILPKKVLKTVETACRSFLWTGKANNSRRALVAWEKICLPKAAGGWNIYNLIIWNKAAIGKLLWNVAQKTDKLWVKWIHGYYIKQQNINTMNIPTQASWVVRKIIGARDTFRQTRNGDQLLQQNSFSVHKLYVELRGAVNKVEWSKILCCNLAPPKNIFICWLAMMGKLATCDHLVKLNIQVDPQCCFCKREDETMSHLFFKCEFSAAVRRKLTTWCKHARQANEWEEERRYVISQARSKSNTQKMFRLVFTVAIYQIWQERNKRRFQGKEMESDQVVRRSQIQIAITCQGNQGLLKMIKD